MQIAALAGLSIRLVDGTLVRFEAPPEGEPGGAGEPRKPKPVSPAPVSRDTVG